MGARHYQHLLECVAKGEGRVPRAIMAECLDLYEIVRTGREADVWGLLGLE